jgi:hypothetical protein
MKRRNFLASLAAAVSAPALPVPPPAKRAEVIVPYERLFKGISYQKQIIWMGEISAGGKYTEICPYTALISERQNKA